MIGASRIHGSRRTGKCRTCINMFRMADLYLSEVKITVHICFVCGVLCAAVLFHVRKVRAEFACLGGLLHNCVLLISLNFVLLISLKFVQFISMNFVQLISLKTRHSLQPSVIITDHLTD